MSVETASYSFNGDNVAGRAVFEPNQPPLHSYASHPPQGQGQGGGSGSRGRAPRRASRTSRRSSAPRRASRTTRRSIAPRRASRTARRSSPARRSSAPRRTSAARRSSAPRRTSRTARSLSRARRSSARRTSTARRSSALKKRTSKRVKPRPPRGVVAKKAPVSPDSNVSSRTLSLTEGSSDERVKKAPVKTPFGKGAINVVKGSKKTILLDPIDTSETLTLPIDTSSGRGGLSEPTTRSQAYYLKFYSGHKTSRLRNALKNASGVEAQTLEILIQNREDMAKNASVDLFDGSALSEIH